MDTRGLPPARDRLEEFKKLRRNAGFDDGEVVLDIDSNVTNKSLLALLLKMGPLYIRLKSLKDTAQDLRKILHEHDNREKFADKINHVKCEARSIRTSVTEVNKMADTSSDLVNHVAQTHYRAMVLIFSEIISELSYLQIETDQQHQQYLMKELLITGQVGISSEELENLITQPSEIFTQNLMQETQMAKQQLQDLQSRHDQFIELEKSIIEVNQLFQELSVLVHEQGDIVDRLENNIFVAKDHIGKAKHEMKEAHQNKVKSRKKKIIIYIVVATILLIITLIILFSFL